MNIKGEYADLQANINNVVFPITLRIGDIINPTMVKTSYSKTITLPFTDTNDRIFSQYFKLDKLVSTISFNALEKTPFTLYINGTEPLFQGWIMLNRITKEGYEITLFSNENKLLNELAEKKLNELDINLDHRVGRYSIWNGWNSDDGMYEYLKYSPSYKGLYQNFTSNKTLNSSATSSVDLENDIDEYQKFEMRSYYQHPSIKLAKLIEQICAENNITIATEPFFSSDNPYWSKLFMVNPKIYNKDNTTSIFKPTYRSDQAGQGQIITNSSGTLTTNTVGRCHSTTIYDDFDMESLYRLDLTKYPSGVIEIDWEFDIEIEAVVQATLIQQCQPYNYMFKYAGLTYSTSEAGYPIDYRDSFFVIESYITGQNNKYSQNKLRFGFPSLPYGDPADYGSIIDTMVISVPDTYSSSYTKFHFSKFNTDAYTEFTENREIENYNALPTTYKVSGKSIINNDGTDAYISFTLKGYNSYTNTYTTPALRQIPMGYPLPIDASFYKDLKLRFKVIENDNLVITAKPFTGQIRSNYKLTKDNLLDPAITQSQLLINYMKMFGLMLNFDKVTNKYILSTRNYFYQDAQRIDWTYKVNPDDIDLKPNDIEARKYTLKYSDINTTHYNRYKDIFNQEYSSVYIDTNNQHLDNTEDFYTSIFTCPLIEQSYNYDEYNVQYRLPWQTIGWCNYDGIKRSASIPDKPTLMLWNGLKEQTLTLTEMQPYMILSDDTYVMRNANEFFWSNYPQKGETVDSNIQMVRNGLSVFPQFTSLIPYTASLDFSVPKLTFFETEPNALTDEICLYNRFYEGYVNDKLSIHNRIIEIPVNLNNNDILNFKFNNFYYIKNTPFVVTEIKDYNPAIVGPTKVIMQRVVDLNNYVGGQTILVNDIRSINGTFSIPSQSGEQPYETNLYTIYRVPDTNLVTDEGYYYDGIYHSGVSIGDEEIDMNIPRGYQEDFKIVRPYIVYDGLTYLGEPYKLTFIPYTATFSGFTKTTIVDTYSFALDYITNGVVTSQGMYINGVEYIAEDLTSPIIIEGLPQDIYNVTGWIKLNDDRILTSNSYYVQS